MKKKHIKIWEEFKKFINRGNVVDMAVGVIMGSAFGAIVTAFTNILLSVCTWGVPGGLKGLFTVLPAANSTQAGLDGIGQKFAASDLQKFAEQLAKATYGETNATAAIVETQKTALLSKYTLHGNYYIYNQSAIIDWGTFINAIISFLIIAITLFTILKIFTALKKKRADLEAKALEEYYTRHPEERPVPPVPGKPQPTELQVLMEIRDSLKTKEEAK